MQRSCFILVRMPQSVGKWCAYKSYNVILEKKKENILPEFKKKLSLFIRDWLVARWQLDVSGHV